MASDLFRRFLKHLQAKPLAEVRGRVLVAVSGGADSVALLSLLQRAAGELDLQPEVAHLDHGLRPESARDAVFVAELAARFELPCRIERRNVAAAVAEQKGGPEEVARRVRRRFLEQIARDQGCPWIALGHQRDDQAETFLLHLLRGAGTRGLAGMAGCDPPYVRPLLPFTRAEIEAYLVEQNLPWREDASNRDPDFTRNRVRHELMPLLLTFNPQIGRHLAALCAEFADEETAWQELAAREFAAHGQVDEDGIYLPCEPLRQLPKALARRTLRTALGQIRGDLRGIERIHVESTLELLDSAQPQAELNLPGAWVGRRYQRLWLRTQPPSVEDWQPLTVAGPGTYPLPDGRWLEISAGQPAAETADDTVEVCAAAEPFPWQIRTPRPGDRMQPAGMRGTRKLQDLFVDLKVTKEQRRCQPLVCRGARILWVVGLRRCQISNPAGRAAGDVLRMRLIAAKQP